MASFEQFVRGMLQCSITCDAQGRACTFNASAVVPLANGRVFRFERSIPLQPLMDALHQWVKAYHSRIHGELGPGYGRNPLHPPAPLPSPFGAMPVNPYGSDASVSPYGLPYDASVSGGLFGTFDIITSVAKQIAASKAGQELFEEVKKRRGLIAEAIAPGIGGEVLDIVEKAYKVIKDARNGDVEASAKIVRVSEHAAQGDEASQKVMVSMKYIADKLRDKERKGRPKVLTHGELRNAADIIAAGWVYNRPYRSTIEAMAIDKTPGNLMRYFYHDGNR